MVHSVCVVLAHRTVSVGDLSFGLAPHTAAANFRHRCSWSSELDQRAVLSPSEASSWTTRYLTRRCLSVDYHRINARLLR